MKSLRIVSLSVVTSFPLCAHASELGSAPSAMASYDASNVSLGTRIIGGKPAKTCHWPSTALILSHATNPATKKKGLALCTGTLVHPEILITAGHCNDEGILGISFTDSLESLKNSEGKIDGTKLEKMEYCKSHPNWGGGNLKKHYDFTYCKLKKPRTDLQLTPIAMGCEVEAIKSQMTVTPVGFGREVGDKENPKSQGGVKYEVNTKFQKYSASGEAIVGVNGKGVCNGDSGGPIFFKLPEDKYGKDAGWRVFGVTSWGPSGPNCDGPAYFGMMHTFVEFVEKDSGIDITPCTDAKGNWKPTKDCKKAPLDPYTASGDWEKGCVAADAGGWIASCGDPFSKEPLDEKAPELEVASPSEGDEIEEGEKVEVEVKAEDDSKIAEVVLVLDGEEQDADEKKPYKWKLKDLKVGEHEVFAKAKDEWGNAGESEKLKFTVIEEVETTSSEPGDDETTSMTGGDADDDETTGTKTSSSDSSSTSTKKKKKNKTEDEDDDGEDSSSDEDDANQKGTNRNRGCSLVDGAGDASGWAILGLVGVLGWRRKRSLGAD